MTAHNTASLFISRLSMYLSASLLQVGVALISVPLVTRLLDPRDIGAFALVTAITGLLGLIAEMGGSIVLSGNIPRLSKAEIPSLLSTVVIVSVLASLLCTVVMISFWPLVESYFARFQIPWTGVALAAIAFVPHAIWSSCNTYLVVSGQAARASQLTMLMVLVSFVVTITALYAFRVGVLALFMGSLFGLVAAAVGGIGALRDELTLRVERRWLMAILHAAPSSSLSGICSGAQILVERSVLSTYSGLTALGLYSHSQQYSAYLNRSIKAVTNAVWPTALKEALDTTGRFERLGRAWRPVYAGLTAIGFILAFFSPGLVGLLTHGKFIAAAPLVPLWVAYILVQNAGKPSTAVLYAFGHGRDVSRAQSGTSILAMALLVALVPLLNTFGAMVAVFAAMAAFRVVIGLLARRFRPFPFQDGWVVGGVVLILASTALNTLLILPLEIKLPITLVGVGMITFLARAELADALEQFNRSVALNPINNLVKFSLRLLGS